MQMASSRFFVRLKNIHVYTILLFLVCASFKLAVADIGETFTLKMERQELVQRVELLSADTTASAKSLQEIATIQKRILALDKQIFKSYDETMERMALQKIQQDKNSQLSVYLALGTSTIAILFAILMLLIRSRLHSDNNAGLMDTLRLLIIDFMSKVSAEKASAQKMLRVNIVVVIGLIMMSVSVVAFLISSL
jgi:hypothetical protein